MSETKILVVSGNPVFHSLSPQLFNFLFDQMGIDAVYTRLAASSAEEVLKTAGDMKLAGLNITSPFKEEVFHLVDKVDRHSLKIKATNCLVFQEGNWVGYNTDFIGVILALKKSGINAQNKNVVILGAGGASRAAAYGLIRARAKSVTLLNRTFQRAKTASRELGCDTMPFELAEKVLRETDILISCLPFLPPLISRISLKKGLTVLNANYMDSSPPFLNLNSECQIIDGRKWLVQQALPAFKLFIGQKVPRILQERLWNNILTKKPTLKPNLALVGFMGSGKTVVGRKLAEKTGFEFVDMDTLIGKESGMTIPEIFNKLGEKAFRDLEKSLISEKIPSSKRTVFSLGGGAVLDPGNCQILKKHCHVIWLWVSSKTALSRINIRTRPLLNASNLEANAENILRSRMSPYGQVSDLVISTEFNTPEETARRIKDEMDQTFPD